MMRSRGFEGWAPALIIPAVFVAGCSDRVTPSEVVDEPEGPTTVEIPLPAGPEYGGAGGFVAFDLDGDSEMELLVTGSESVNAVSTDGSVLWQHEVDLQVSTVSEENGLPGWDGAGVQAADMDGDGDVEVLFLTRSGELHAVDGLTGEVFRQIPLASPDGSERWEHLVVANFRGQGDRDLLLQATNATGYRMGRYLAAFAFEELLSGTPPSPLWTRDDFQALAHGGARAVDLDADGRDEVVSASIVGPDGDLLFDLTVEGHLDAVHFADVRPDLPGLEVIGLEESSLGLDRPQAWLMRQIDRLRNETQQVGNRVFLFKPEGLVWETDHLQQEPQNAAVGDFDPDRAGLEIWCRSRYETEQEPFVFDAQGELAASYSLAERAPPDWTDRGVEVVSSIHWTGGPRALVAAKARHEAGDVAIFDALTGEFVERFTGEASRIYVADVLGDWREEILVIHGSSLRIHVNPAPNPDPGRDRLWSDPAYRRAKQNWNYYGT